MPVNAEIGTKHPANTTALGGNTTYKGMEWKPKNIPEYHVYLYNVSERNFEKVGPYQNVNIAGVTLEDRALKGMKPNQRYHYVTSFPQPMMMPILKADEGLIDTAPIDARRYVMDIINPNNMTFSLDTAIRPDQVFSVGNDLSIKGVFFSYSNPPSEQDVEGAYKRMEKYYTALLTKAETLELTDKAKLATELTYNPDYAFAANYFGKTTSWHKGMVRPEECPNCHDQRPAGALFHVNKDLGFVCIDPSPRGWKAAYSAGIKTKAQVPDEMKWWSDEPEKKADKTT